MRTLDTFHEDLCLCEDLFLTHTVVSCPDLQPLQTGPAVGCSLLREVDESYRETFVLVFKLDAASGNYFCPMQILFQQVVVNELACALRRGRSSARS